MWNARDPDILAAAVHTSVEGSYISTRGKGPIRPAPPMTINLPSSSKMAECACRASFIRRRLVETAGAGPGASVVDAGVAEAAPANLSGSSVLPLHAIASTTASAAAINTILLGAI